MDKSGIKLDELDQKLLGELEGGGFQKTFALAQLFGVGDRTIRRRISQMRSDGVLKIIGIPNPVMLGYRAWAKIGIRVKPGSSEYVARALVEHPSVYFVAYALGTFDVIIAVHFDATERLTHFINSELTGIPGIIGSEAMMLAYPRKYYNFSWAAPLPGNNFGHALESLMAASTYYQVDDIDRKIISIVREDGLVRPASLKSRLGIGESVIRKRLKDMLKREVFRIAVVPNPEILDYQVWATMGITINHQFAHRVIDETVKHPAVYLASISLGRFNILIAARFQNIDSLNRFVKIELPAIEGISSVETFLHTKPLKYHNIDWSHTSKEQAQPRPVKV